MRERLVAIENIIISIHAPRGGSDFRDMKEHERLTEISIHAPRGGSDFRVICMGHVPYNFNPRSPWGERRLSGQGEGLHPHFNPRSPWGERQQICTNAHLQTYTIQLNFRALVKALSNNTFFT